MNYIVDMAKPGKVMKKRKIILPSLLILIAAIGFMEYKYFNKPVKSLVHATAVLKITEATLIKRFETDEQVPIKNSRVKNRYFYYRIRLS